MNNPALPDPTDAQLSYEIRLVQKHYEKGDCRIDCPMYSELRECCTVLEDDLDLDECPAFEGLIAEAQRAMEEEHESIVAWGLE